MAAIEDMAADQWEFYTRTAANAVIGYGDSELGERMAQVYRDSTSPETALGGVADGEGAAGRREGREGELCESESEAPAHVTPESAPSGDHRPGSIASLARTGVFERVTIALQMWNGASGGLLAGV